MKNVDPARCIEIARNEMSVDLAGMDSNFVSTENGAPLRDFTRLKVWQKAFDLAVRLEAAMPLRTGRGIPGLRAQTLRAAASISATICEGCGKESDAELLRYLDMSIGSSKELFNHMLMASAVGLLSPTAYAELEAQREDVIKMLCAFRRYVRNRAEPDA